MTVLGQTRHFDSRPITSGLSYMKYHNEVWTHLVVEAPREPSFANNTPGQIFGSKLFSESPTSPAKGNVWVSAGGLSGASSHFRYGATVMSYL
jgi:hypothetical protein